MPRKLIQLIHQKEELVRREPTLNRLLLAMVPCIFLVEPGRSETYIQANIELNMERSDRCLQYLKVNLI